MDLFDRIFQLHQILSSSRYPVARSVLEGRLECSRATLTRIIFKMRNYLGAPIKFDLNTSGYQYEKIAGQAYELPGLWFNASELHALLAVQRLLEQVQPGLLETHIAPLKERIDRILQSRHLGSGEIERVRILGMAARRIDPENFRSVAGAVLLRKRMNILYHGRNSNQITERDVSPQRLIHYRDNWYLDVWDHDKKTLRSFSVDRIKKARLVNKATKTIPDKDLDKHFASSYGIFGGLPKHKAILRFSSERARWVADEEWHPKQEGCYEGECYVLRIPYADSRELVMDILKHGPEVEVLGPDCLRTEVVDQLVKALGQYKGLGKA